MSALNVYNGMYVSAVGLIFSKYTIPIAGCQTLMMQTYVARRLEEQNREGISSSRM